MIYFNFNLRNPWWSDRFKNIWWKSGATYFKNKFWELQIIKSDNLFRLEFGFTVRQDHAGTNLEFGLFGYEIHFTFYDNRHWNEEQGRWMIYSEEQGLH